MAEPPLILVAERDLQVRQLQQFFLERAGFAVEFRDSGVDALAAAVALGPAVLVTEILVPGLDGLTLCRRLREDPRTRRIPVVVFSILAAAARAADAGAAAFLRKPFVETTFLAAIQTSLASQNPVLPSPGSMETRWASK